MNKYLKLLLYEFKNILRDKMSLIMLLYPLLMIGIGAYVIPNLIDTYGGDHGTGQETAVLVIIIIFSSIAPFVTAAMLGFNLLDHKDENTLDTIRVTPLSLKGYVFFKTVYAYLLSVNASFFTLFGVKHLSGDGYTIHGQNLWDRFTAGSIFIYAAIAALFTPVFALFLARIAKNKIEGFAYMKLAGMFMILPAILVLDVMQDARQYLMGVIPVFWPVKGLMVDAGFLTHNHNLPYIVYMIVGVVYALFLIFITYRGFEKSLT